MNDCRKDSSHHAPRDEARTRDRLPKANVYGMASHVLEVTPSYVNSSKAAANAP